MLKKELKTLEGINEYYNSEMAAHNKYLNYSSYLDGKNVIIYGKFLADLAKDKTDAHMSRTFKYLSYFEFPAHISEKCACKAIDYKRYNEMKLKDAVIEIFQDVYKTELALREEIYKISREALDAKDIETFNYTQWFIDDALKDIGDVENVIFSLTNLDLIIGERSIKKVK